MRQISSGLTGFYKKTLPIFWFGIMATFVVSILSAGREQAKLALLAIPLGGAILGYVMMRTLYWKLADQVYDCGDHLLVRKGGEEEIIPLSTIVRVDRSLLTNPPRITLRLARTGRFGSAVAFAPVTPLTLNPFAKNRVVEDLIARVDEARRAGSGR